VGAEDKAVEQAADELYAVPPAEFTKARDERAKALRKESKEAADAVKALRRPTVAAWALNLLARRQPKDVSKLLAAGEKLRAAQEELLAGGDRAAFQKSAAAERELVAELAGAATELVAAEGERPGAGLREKVAATLHAAALDEETAAELRAGRLVKEREAIGGFGDFGGSAAPAPAPAPAKRGAKPAARPAGKPKPEPKGPDPALAARQRLAAAETDERHARRALDSATRAVEQATARAEAAKTRAEAARAHAEETAAKAAEAAKQIKETRRTAAAAEKAHARAQKAVAEAKRKRS
jgi:hypothetical protein